MKPEDASRDRLVDQLLAVKKTVDSALRIIKNRHILKASRINALYKKRHELTSAYRHSIQRIDDEIKVTRSSEDYSRALSSRSSDVTG